MKGIDIALLWDKELTYKRYLIDHGFTCEVIRPGIIAAPFFSLRLYKVLLVPAGFGNPFYSRILTELRATSEGIKQFIRSGGTLLVSGAFADTDAYNWLPIRIKYVQEARRVKIELVKEHEAAAIVEPSGDCFCDGYFEDVDPDCEVVMKRGEDKKPLLVFAAYGAGRIIATTIHEYPSSQFITYCVGP